jgi:hypothetical protein
MKLQVITQHGEQKDVATAQIPQRLTCQAALHFTGTGLLNYHALRSQSPVTSAGTEQSSTSQSGDILL